jgi:hypothetical protein
MLIDAEAQHFRKLFPFYIRKSIFSRYNKVPLWRLPLSLPFHPLANPKLHKSSMVLAKTTQRPQKTTAPSSAKGGCYV